jgi:exopolysaccharide biosynthesis polyprenyl glycosylphosphotransferase
VLDGHEPGTGGGATPLRHTSIQHAGRLDRSIGATSPGQSEEFRDFRQRLLQVVDERTLELVARRRLKKRPKGRSWLVRRLLLIADLLGLTLAFLTSAVLSGTIGSAGWMTFSILALSLPAWIVGAKLFGLYRDDETRTDHTTLDDLARVFLLISVGALPFALVTGYSGGEMTAVLLFWVLGVTLVTLGRTAARSISRRTRAYLQNTVIVGAGDIGQLVARKLLQHPEYGINLVGLVDSDPKARRSDLHHLTLLGTPDELPAIVRALSIERVIIAFSQEASDKTIALIRSLRDVEVQVDIVPRFFEAIGPKVDVHTLEGVPLLSLPPAALSPSSRLMKRSVDLVGATIGLVVATPLILVIALLIWLDSGLPIIFRQRRLGMGLEQFTILKFRTMRRGTGDGAHRAALAVSMDSNGREADNGLYKPDQSQEITRVGTWLRKTSLDELPQLVNVLRGEMSLVGPRPSLPYEIEHFAPHHFERFSVPPGITGLWQVTARAQSTWREAIEMDVAYVRDWSIGLDIWLICRTPVQMLRLKTR